MRFENLERQFLVISNPGVRSRINGFQRSPHFMPHMKRILFLSLAFILISVAAIGVNHYLFLRRLSHLDAKIFHHHVYALTTAKTEDQRSAAIRRIQAAPEFRDFDVALVSDHVLLLHTRSLFSHAYIIAYQLGPGETWAIGCLRGGKFSRMGTYTPPSNLGGS